MLWRPHVRSERAHDRDHFRDVALAEHVAERIDVPRAPSLIVRVRSASLAGAPNGVVRTERAAREVAWLAARVRRRRAATITAAAVARSTDSS